MVNDINGYHYLKQHKFLKNVTMKREEAAEQYKWSQFALYPNIDACKQDILKIQEISNKIATLINKLANKNNFKQLVEWEFRIIKKIHRLTQFVHYGDLDQSNNVYRDLQTEIENVFNICSMQQAFIEPELKKVGERQISAWIGDDQQLLPYRYHYRKFFRMAQHILDVKSEYLLNVVSRSRSGVSNLYDTLSYADRKKVMVTYHDKKQELTPTLYKEIMEKTDPSKDQNFRFETALQRNAYLKEHKMTFAKLYELNVVALIEEVRLRSYQDFLQAALEKDNISTDFFNEIIDFGKNNSQVRSRFLKLNRSYLQKKHKLDKFYVTDSQLAVGNIKKRLTYSVTTAKTLIRESLQSLGDEYLNYLEKAWGDNKIDYFSSVHKREGAYSSGGAIHEIEPIILMNWDNTINSVRTLAHEVGHSVHTYFANTHQPFPLNDYPIIQAEVASTLNEHLLFEHMLKSAEDDQVKMSLLHDRISDIIGTFFRQLQLEEFEKQAHLLVATHKPLNCDVLNNLFKSTDREFNAVKYDKYSFNTLDYAWPMVLHFFKSPFYVYKYASSIVASFYFFDQIKKNGIDNYLSFLKAGGCKEPLQIFTEHGINFKNIEPYQILVGYVSGLVDQLEHLYQKDLQE